MNSVTLVGRLAADPDLRFIPTTGRAVVNFRLAVDKELSKEKREEFKQQGKQTADFIQIVVYGKSAENCANYTKKGRMCAVQGRISTRTYTSNNGEKRFVTEVVANRVEFIEWSRKKQGQAQSDYENGIWQPVDDEEIPF